jgi:hypothetical protein
MANSENPTFVGPEGERPEIDSHALQVLQLLRSPQPADWQLAMTELDGHIDAESWIVTGFMHKDFTADVDRQRELRSLVGGHIQQFQPTLEQNVRRYTREASFTRMRDQPPYAQFSLGVITDQPGGFVGTVREGMTTLRTLQRPEIVDLLRVARGIAPALQGEILDGLTSTHGGEVRAALSAAEGAPALFASTIRGLLTSSDTDTARAAIRTAQLALPIFNQDLISLYEANRNNLVGYTALVALGGHFVQNETLLKKTAFGGEEMEMAAATFVFGQQLQAAESGKKDQYKDLLIQKLRDPSGDVRQIAINGLAPIAAEIPDVLRKVLREDDQI